MSIETCHSANVKRNYNANIVSTGEDEAKEKLVTADMLWASIPDEMRDLGLKPVKWHNAVDLLSFHEPPYTSNIGSKPGTSAIRGGKKDMYYDEAAFIKEFPRLFQAGLPAITRGEGRVTVVSTPMGQSGLFYDLWNEPKWSHHEVPWWESRFMVKGALDSEKPYDVVNEAIALSPEMNTEERIERFASEKLLEILYTGLRGDLISFQTEYECMFVDETNAYFPYDLIRSCVDLKNNGKPKPFNAIGEITIGVDLAKERDQTVFTVVEHLTIEGKKNYRVLFSIATMADYDDQFVQLKNLVFNTGATRVSIDSTGAGNMFYEKARNEGLGKSNVNIEGCVFTQAKKENWATTFKGDLQLNLVSLPEHKEMLAQIHEIQRTRTENNHFKFAGKKDDYFWSLMLACYGEGHEPARFYRI